MSYRGKEGSPYLSRALEDVDGGRLRTYLADKGLPPPEELFAPDPSNGALYRSGTSEYPGQRGAAAVKMEDYLRSPDGLLYVVPDSNGNLVPNQLARKSNNGNEEKYRGALFLIAKFHERGAGVIRYRCNQNLDVDNLDVDNFVLTPIEEVQRNTRPPAVPPAGKYIAEG